MISTQRIARVGSSLRKQLTAQLPSNQKELSAWVEVSLQAIRRNVARVRQRVGPKTRVIAVVKANAYGHGAVEVGKAAVAAGASMLAVYSADEGASLRDGGIVCPILVLGPSSPLELEAAVINGLTPTICDLASAEHLSRVADQEVPVHVKVDTGLNRFGIAAQAAVGLIERVQALPHIRLEGMFTHFAGLDASDRDSMRAQLAQFQQVLAALAARGIRVPLRHASNSLATWTLPEATLDAVRVGGTIYGLAEGDPELEPALALKARVVLLKAVPAGAEVGYGGTHHCRRATRLALLPVGYGDGLPRLLSNKGYALVRGERAPIVGLISMNQMVVDVTDVDNVALGDVAVLLGAQGKECITAAALAGLTGGCAYELTTMLRAGLRRVWK